MFYSSIQKFIKERNYPNLNIKAVLFDMDGVLLDSMEKHAVAWKQTMDDYGIPFTVEEIYLYEGQPGPITIDEAFQRHFGRNSTEEEAKELYRVKSTYIEAMEPIGPMVNAGELLDQVKAQGLETYLVTGSGQQTIIDMLDKHFPGVFPADHMVTAMQDIPGKPAPDPYLRALSIAGVQAWEAIVIENAPLGVESSVAAGICTIAINTGPLSSELLKERGAQIVLDGGMTELNEKWQEIAASLNI